MKNILFNILTSQLIIKMYIFIFANQKSLDSNFFGFLWYYFVTGLFHRKKEIEFKSVLIPKIIHIKLKISVIFGHSTFRRRL